MSISASLLGHAAAVPAWVPVIGPISFLLNDDDFSWSLDDPSSVCRSVDTFVYVLKADIENPYLKVDWEDRNREAAEHMDRLQSFFPSLKNKAVLSLSGFIGNLATLALLIATVTPSYFFAVAGIFILGTTAFSIVRLSLACEFGISLYIAQRALNAAQDIINNRLLAEPSPSLRSSLTHRRDRGA